MTEGQPKSTLESVNHGIYSKARDRGLLGELTPMSRDVLGLRYGSSNSLSLAEVGRIIGKSPTTARKVEQQGLERLRTLLRD